MKKLGIINFLINFIWLPCVVITYAFSLINNIIYTVLSVKNSPFSFVTYEIFMCFILAFVVISAVKTIIAISKCCSSTLSWIGCFLTFYCAERFLATISMFLYNDLEITFWSVPFGLLPYAIVTILVFKYYKNRRHHFNAVSESGNDEAIIGSFSVIIYISMFLVEGITLYEMFNQSVGYGLFGLFVPVISQIIHIINVGFASPFAYMVYVFITLCALMYIFPLIINYCEEIMTCNEIIVDSENNAIDNKTKTIQYISLLPKGIGIDPSTMRPYKLNRKYGYGREFNAFITPSGKYYHKSKCRYIKGHKKQFIHRYDAILKFTPCPLCKPKSQIDEWYYTFLHNVELNNK